jgi:hypothetical protein
MEKPLPPSILHEPATKADLVRLRLSVNAKRLVPSEPRKEK